ncbi:MAG: hypothetical protein HZB26_05405 [Candidatus Hydrogenedentes bacterium]|nr:hypothetical protein [Candidatus Hydrogenedentota bacterium]
MKHIPGGPGASLAPDKQAKVGLKADTFTLDTPMMSTKLAQGESKSLTIGIKRGKDTDEDVTLKFNDLPKGVTIDPMNPVIKHGDMDAKVMLIASDDAALGDFTAKVLGHPAKGLDSFSDLKLTVDKK